jgi:hypothetical protein
VPRCGALNIQKPLHYRGSSAEIAVTGRIKFSEGTSAKWIFDVEIEKNGAEILVHVEKTKIMLGEQKNY